MRTREMGMPLLAFTFGVAVLLSLWVFPARSNVLGLTALLHQPIIKGILTALGLLAVILSFWFFFRNPYAKPRKLSGFGAFKESGASVDDFLREKREDTAREETEFRERHNKK